MACVSTSSSNAAQNKFAFYKNDRGSVSKWHIQLLESPKKYRQWFLNVLSIFMSSLVIVYKTKVTTFK